MWRGSLSTPIIPVFVAKSLTGKGKSVENQSGREVFAHLPHPDMQQTNEV